MSENLHNIDKLFRDGIESHEDMPDEKLWEGIDAGLDKSNVVDIRRKYNNLKKVAAVLLLMLLSVVGYEILKPKSKDKETAAVKNNTPAVVNNNATPNQTKSNTSTGEINNYAANAAQSNTVNSAVYDSLSNVQNTVAGNINATQPANGTAPVINNAVNSSNVTSGLNNSARKNKKQKAGLPGNGVTVNDEAYSKSGSNKKGSHRTKITVKAPQQYTDGATDEEGTGESSANATQVTAAVLKSVQNEKASSLAARINKAIANETAPLQRQSPDVAMAKIKRRKNLSISVMPFYAAQFVSNKIKEEKMGQPGGQGPGGPPPPRPGNNGHKEQYKQEEQSQTSYSAGIIAEMALGNNFGLQSGITYLQRTSTIEPKKIYARPDKDGKVKYVFDCASGYSYISSKTGATPITGDSINVTTSKNTQGYIGVPLALTYKILLGKKLSIIPTAGAVFNFIAKQKIQTQLVQGSVKEQQTINSINGLSSNYINATAGLAVEYDINKRIALNIMPSGNFALSSINNSDAAVKSYPNAFVFAAGFKIKL